MKSSKGSYPFRVGCTSYVLPDSIIPNIEYMGPYIDDIELVLFESPEVSNLPSGDDVKRMRELAEEYGITYSVHFPTTHKVCGSGSSALVSDLMRVTELMSVLEPFAWILHLDGLSASPSEDEVYSWAESSAEVLSALSAAVEDMSLVAVENLSYGWRLHEGLVREHGASLCLDLGHLWINAKGTWEADVHEMLPRTRAVHLHGVSEGKDHVSLKKADRADLCSFVSLLRTAGYEGLVTVEVFNEGDTAESLDALAQLWG